MEAAAGLRIGARPLLAIALKMASIVVFVGMSTSIKLTGPIPTGQIVFFRSAFAILPILVFLAWRSELSTAFRTARPVGHVLRGLTGMVGMYLSFFGLTRLPLPEVTTLNYALPLIVVAFSAIFLGERVGIYRWTAVIVGLLGVIVIALPRLTLFTSGAALNDTETLGVIAILANAVVAAAAMLQVRGLVNTESSSTIVLWFSSTCALCGLASWPWGWATLSGTQAALLISAGLCGGVAQILMTESYRHADISIIAPFEYTSMLLAIAVGYFIFGDIPTIYTLVGGTIVVGAGILIILRERQLGLERAKARKVTPPQ